MAKNANYSQKKKIRKIEVQNQKFLSKWNKILGKIELNSEGNLTEVLDFEKFETKKITPNCDPKNCDPNI